ncbi:MAG: LOW QUALITY PROTEIN: hypothetical protein BJ554DRAFT_5548, partial [Olpidium bornovanus]
MSSLPARPPRAIPRGRRRKSVDQRRPTQSRTAAKGTSEAARTQYPPARRGAGRRLAGRFPAAAGARAVGERLRVARRARPEEGQFPGLQDAGLRPSARRTSRRAAAAAVDDREEPVPHGVFAPVQHGGELPARVPLGGIVRRPLRRQHGAGAAGGLELDPQPAAEGVRDPDGDLHALKVRQGLHGGRVHRVPDAEELVVRERDLRVARLLLRVVHQLRPRDQRVAARALHQRRRVHHAETVPVADAAPAAVGFPGGVRDVRHHGLLHDQVLHVPPRELRAHLQHQGHHARRQGRGRGRPGVLLGARVADVGGGLWGKRGRQPRAQTVRNRPSQIPRSSERRSGAPRAAQGRWRTYDEVALSAAERDREDGRALLAVVRLHALLRDRADGDRVRAVGVPVEIAVVLDGPAVPGGKHVDGSAPAAAAGRPLREGALREEPRALDRRPVVPGAPRGAVDVVFVHVPRERRRLVAVGRPVGDQALAGDAGAVRDADAADV